MILKPTLFLSFSLLLTGCVTRTPAHETISVEPQSLVPQATKAFYEKNRQIEAKLLSEANQSRIMKWVDFYAGRGHERFQRYLHRGAHYRPIILSVLEKEEMPAFLYYLAMIESGFATHAESPRSAVGVWQFIPGTARRYGPSVNRYVDERRDPIRATIAATRYLKDLSNVFHSWPLAMAAYNTGEGRVMSSIMRAKSRDYWELVEKKALHSETQEYVAKVYAALMIGENPQKYGFTVEEEPMPELVTAKVSSPARLSEIAERLSVPLATLKTWNPHILGDLTPPSDGYYRIWLPKNQNLNLGELASIKRSQAVGTPLQQEKEQNRYDPQSNEAKERSSQILHLVRPGDTLGRIARKHGMSVRHLKSVNSLRSNRLQPGMQLQIKSKAIDPKIYTVRQGDSWYSLAQKFGTSVNALKRLNSRKSSRLMAGQVITINRQS